MAEKEQIEINQDNFAAYESNKSFVKKDVTKKSEEFGEDNIFIMNQC